MLCSVNQEEAKQNALTQLDEESSLIYHGLGDEISATAMLEVLHLGYICYEAKASEKALKQVIIVCTTTDKQNKTASLIYLPFYLNKLTQFFRLPSLLLALNSFFLCS